MESRNWLASIVAAAALSAPLTAAAQGELVLYCTPQEEWCRPMAAAFFAEHRVRGKCLLQPLTDQRLDGVIRSADEILRALGLRDEVDLTPEVAPRQCTGLAREAPGELRARRDLGGRHAGASAAMGTTPWLSESQYTAGVPWAKAMLGSASTATRAARRMNMLFTSSPVRAKACARLSGRILRWGESG